MGELFSFNAFLVPEMFFIKTEKKKEQNVTINLKPIFY